MTGTRSNKILKIKHEIVLICMPDGMQEPMEPFAYLEENHDKQQVPKLEIDKDDGIELTQDSVSIMYLGSNF